MKKTLILILIMAAMTLSIFGCASDAEEAPDGLQICISNEKDGFIFYAPENWAIINGGDVWAAKVSAVNSMSISFVEAEMPVESIPEYFEKSLSEFTENIKSSLNITLRDSACTFGNADGEAYKYIYSYKYQDYDVVCMQILLTHGENFYIFTYTSHGDPADESSTYRQYLDSVQLAIDSFKFTEKSEKIDEVVYEKDADGYNMVSSETLAGFSLYLPEDYEVVYSSGFVKAKISEGANLSLSKATQTGVGIIDYLKLRKDELSAFATDFTDVKIQLATDINPESEVYKNWQFDTLPEKNEGLTFGDLEKNQIILYEYKYTFNGRIYCVYQMMGVDNLNGYVFTYTALEEEYNAHIDEIKIILEKVRF